MTTFGFIGTGNMAGALVRAACKSMNPGQILLANRTPAKAQALADELGCVFSDNQTVAEQADYIFLGVKPQMMAGLLDSLRATLAQRKTRFILVNMAAGLSIADIQHMAGDSYPVLRIMPNTPASIGEGIILYTPSDNVTTAETDAFVSGMGKAGRLSALPEHLLDAGSCISGCGPAFVDLFIEGLADGGVACGVPRKQAIEFAAQMVAGAAKLVLETGKHPGELKDAVCSPGGTTIQGVRELEENGFRATAMNAVIAAYDKTVSLMK